MSLAVFEFFVVPIALLGALACGTYVLGKALPQVAAALGLAAGALSLPGLVAGPWAGMVCAAILVVWPQAPSHPDLSALSFVACCMVGGAWKPVRTLLER